MSSVEEAFKQAFSLRDYYRVSIDGSSGWDLAISEIGLSHPLEAENMPDAITEATAYLNNLGYAQSSLWCITSVLEVRSVWGSPA